MKIGKEQSCFTIFAAAAPGERS